MVDGVVGASINDISITVAENIKTTNIVIFNFLYIVGFELFKIKFSSSKY